MEEVNLINSHFWVSAGPFIRSTLVFGSLSGGAAVGISLYDPDGQLIQESRVFSDIVSSLSLESLLEGCKFDSGMRHAHLVVRHSADTSVKVYMVQGDSGQVLEPAHPISDSLKMGFPVSFGDKNSSEWLCLLNSSKEETTVRGRLFVGNRSPEVSWKIAGNGARVVNLSSDLIELLTAAPADANGSKGVTQSNGPLSGYLRLVNSISNPVMAHLLEWDNYETQPLLSVVN